ncbi:MULTISPECIES: glycoside hydrolase family 127 protein [unclassified Rhizobium]|uniref:glycoside hydrolase family 127 protein n=1 Tax=unclassified Rhizobium TaxID=2613769 RepID=UPI001ADB76F9|nr:MULTISPECIES: beta-L-arabinofuranosidase domain-containing protein [unclassified Rhizobium]MBO9101274.1 glycoside hydrolase family 127 protein [Rhizobium sp. L58/93]MBO9171833.1 glycoside hydrolase family 127 protein [Rhizobium sp. L245/93]MBO9182714.1 glycoside hydrolase family 127 protein [Rhizobium sp. E27B/91]QXZ86428.1 glycoside hydrolase family 127 protein [Rhizobium sp. K1/93]QXZ92117.1 glycoside hydrolase family 127 protein [Rhizobium sp. K15/93]
MSVSDKTTASEPDGRPARFVPADHSRVEFSGGFWQSWTETVRSVTIPSQHDCLEEEGFLEVLDFGKPPGPLARPIQPSGLSMQHFFDSDFGKWIEAASYTLKAHPDVEIEAKIEAIVEKLEQGQMADGYLNSWFIRREPEKRWTNLRDLHEMYSMGHLLEGAVAYFEATGKRRFLDVMIRAVDHIIDTFGPEPGKLRGYDAHEEIELALVKLYRVTRDPRHLDLAVYFVDERGAMPSYYDEEARKRGENPDDYVYQTYAYSQAHIPVREQTQVVGHAVRAMYLFSAMADLAHENNDPALFAICDRLFDNLTSRQLYVTGGLGPSASNEGFTREYDLPNETAYAETCAAVALGFWGHRMAQIDLDRRFTDSLETVLFNGALSGISRDGQHYFYENVLESHGQNRRWKWHYCPCCPTNIARFITSLGQYFYSARDGELAVHLYGANTAELSVGNAFVRLRQETRYPWDGDIGLRLGLENATPLTVKLRIPGWCLDATIAVNGEPVDLRACVTKGYAYIAREWRDGDEIRLSFDMPVQRLYAHPAASEDSGRVALRRGPVVYCVEETDIGGEPQRLRLPADAVIGTRFDAELLGGAMVLEGEALEADASDWSDSLYRTSPPALVPKPFKAIPYHLWANREPGAMLVWLQEN